MPAPAYSEGGHAKARAALHKALKSNSGMNHPIASFRCDPGTLDWLEVLFPHVRLSGSVRRKCVAPRVISTIKWSYSWHVRLVRP